MMFLHICIFNISYVKLWTGAVRDIIQNYISHTRKWNALIGTPEKLSNTLLKCYFTLMCEKIFVFSAYLLCFYYYAL